MPLSSLLGALLLCAEPTADSIPQTNDSTSDALRRAPITVRHQQERMLADLKVQAALREARKQLAEQRFEAAIATLEPWVRHADGCDKFLTTLESAYRAQIGVLVRGHNTDAARLMLDRLQSLSPRADSKLDAYRSIEQPAAKSASRPQAPTTVELAAASTPTPKKDPPNLLAKLIPFAKSTPKKALDQKIVARAKLDDRDEPTVVAASATASSTATQARPEPKEPDPLEEAERHYQARDFRKALSCFEAAYQRGPAGKIQEARNRYGYCLLRITYEKHEPLTSAPQRSPDDQAWRTWEADIKQGRRLVNIPQYIIFADEQLDLLQKRKARLAATVPAAAQPAVTASTAAIIRPEAAERGAPADDFRHLPGQVGAAWSVMETTNFRVLHRDRALAEAVGQIAERARRDAHQLWFPDEPLEDWKPKCDLVLYQTAEEFAATTKQLPQSPAFARIDNRRGWIASRSIELRADEPNMKGAILPHEIAHAVLAGRFGAYSLPRWADEGMAVLTEPRDKQDQHLTNLSQARRQGIGFSCAQIMGMREYPPQVREFYAHSVGVCRLLVDRGGHRKLVLFLRSALNTNDYEQALQQHYGIRGFSDLEADFNQFVGNVRAGSEALVSAPR